MGLEGKRRSEKKRARDRVKLKKRDRERIEYRSRNALVLEGVNPQGADREIDDKAAMCLLLF